MTMNRKKEVQVGITVILSVIVLVAGLLWFKQVRLAGTVHNYQVDFARVGGLQARDRVQVQGIRMGAVNDFEIVDRQVRVSFYVKETEPLRDDATITLTSMGIVGEMLIEIMPGEGEIVPEGHLFQGEVMSDMNAMMNEGAATLEEARELTREMTAFMKQLRDEDRLARVLDNTAKATETILGTTEEIAPDLKSLVGELRAVTAAVNSAVAGPDSLLAGTLGGAQAAMARIDTLTSLLTDTTVTLAAMMERLDAGEGSAGRLMKDESLYEEAEETIVMVQDLITDIKARPKRYFHVSIF
jgi:phospholipid/cholesterol/gamma-HCH transport system substrate-binding protein